jgi:NADH:ubiquinone oxidoreductase subunit 5 (subunit L)/multisubunit Na+/H+ antiporter MnhA subunit
MRGDSLVEFCVRGCMVNVSPITSKALLFLSAGSVIHAVNDEQDMRKMGGLKNLVPFTYSMLIIGSLALIGFPFLAGFYSKDLVLEVAYGKYSLSGYFSYYLGTLGAFFTAFYSMRLGYLTFLSRPTGHKKVICFAFDSGFQICAALACLAIPSIFIGYYIKDMFVGMGSSFFGTAIFVSLKNVNTFDGEFIHVFYKTLPVGLSILGFFSSYVLYNFGSKFLFSLKVSAIGKKVYYFLNRKWFFDKIYKCGVLIFQCPVLLHHKNVVYDSKLNTSDHLTSITVVYDNVFLGSIGKRIFAMVFLNFRASNVLDKLYLALSNNLHYKVNDLSNCCGVKEVR